MRLTRVQILLLLLFVLALAKALIFANFGLKLLTDDGQNFTGALRLLSGQQIYGDYQAFFPPFADYFLAFIIKLTDFNILLSRYVYALIVSFLFPTLFLIIKKLSNSKIAFFITLVFIFAEVRIDLLFFQTFFLLSFLLAIFYLEKKTFKFLLWSGISLALGSMFRLDLALFAYIGVASLVILDSYFKKNLRTVLRPIIFLSIVPLVLNFFIFAWLIYKESLQIFLSDILAGSFAKTQYNITPISLEKLLPSSLSLVFLYDFVSGWLILVWGFVLTVLIWEVYRRIRLKKITKIEIILTAIFFQIIASSVYLRLQFDMSHLVKSLIIIFPMLGSALVLLNSNIMKFLIFASLSAFLGVQIAYSFWVLNSFNAKLNIPQRGELYINSIYINGTTIASAEMIDESVKFLKQAGENEAVFTAPYLSMLYYLSNRQNPTRYDNLLKGYLFEPFGEEYVVSSLEKEKVKFIVYDRDNGPKRLDGKRLLEYYPKIDQYIMDNFQVEKKIGGWLLMRRKDVK